MLEMALLGNRLLVSISSMTHLDIMHGTSDFNYCPNCGVTAVYSGENGQRILSCECGYVHYKDPKVAVGVLIRDQDNRILLMKRAVLRQPDSENGKAAAKILKEIDA